jgi:hypothetical protein
MRNTLKLCRRFYLLPSLVVAGGIGINGSGCSTNRQSQSNPIASVGAAQVRGTHEFRLENWYKLRLDRVDGKKVNTSWWADWTKPLPIDPGYRTIRVECQFAMNSITESVSLDLNASLKAGHTYQLRCAPAEDAVVFWVEDAATRNKAGMTSLAASTTPPVSPSQAAAGGAVLLLLRTLIFLGAGG